MQEDKIEKYSMDLQKMLFLAMMFPLKGVKLSFCNRNRKKLKQNGTFRGQKFKMVGGNRLFIKNG